MGRKVKPAPASPELPEPLPADQAVKTFFKDPDWMSKMGMGGMLNALALICAVGLITLPLALAAIGLTQGYQLKVIRARLKKASGDMPAWGDWLELLVSGLTWVALQFGVWLIFASIATTVLMLAAALLQYKNVNPWLVYIVGTIAVVKSWFVIHFFSTYLMINFAKEEKLVAGLDFAKVIRTAGKQPGAFLINWLLALSMQAAALLAPCLTIIGIFMMPSTVFAAQLIGISLLAQVWRAADD